MRQLQPNDFCKDRKREVQRALQLTLSKAQSSVNNAASPTYFFGRIIRDIKQITTRGLPLSARDLPAFTDAVVNLHGTINDRQFLLEKVLTMMARLPDDSTFSRIAQQYAITLLYRDLPHPPSGFLSTFRGTSPNIVQGQPVSYAFRSADGSNYSTVSPSLGQAGQPYARSVPSTRVNVHSSLPDPGVVFEALLRRRDNDFVAHPGGLSSMFFAFADLIIHSIFNTNTLDWTINDASSYLDLSIVYGSNTEQVDSMRKKDGTGMIWEDAFADSRLLFMLPSVCALAVLFSRHHNYIAQNILDHNEGGSFKSPPLDETTSLLAQDDEIFHRARLVNTAFFMKVILTDYVGSILGLVRDGLTWRLDPLASYRELDHNLSSRGQGNAVSVEFNLLYRWHASISEQDEKWLNEMYGKTFENKDPKTLTVSEFREVLREKTVPHDDVKTWTFDGLQRGPDGRFADKDLAKILQDATERRAGAFRARGCPTVMRLVEILAIEQGRKWGVCTLNEFRKFIGLRPYQSFQEWNPNPIIHRAAAKLYGDIDNLELHVGLQAEETKPPIPGAGLCPGYTISRAILADAVSLCRGDRFLTLDFTPYNLTSWGYQHCMVNTDDGSYGGMLRKLLFHLLPDQYPAGSTYGHFPFMTPDFMRRYIGSRSTDIIYYDFSRPSQAVDSDRQSNLLYARRVSRLTKGVEVSTEMRKIIVNETCPVASFLGIFKILLEKASVSTSDETKVVDIIKDVIDPASVYWTASFVLGLPVCAFDSVLGGYTVMQWHELFSDVTRYVYLNDHPVRDWTMYRAALNATDNIMHYLLNRLRRHSDGILSLAGATDAIVTSLVTSNVQNDRFIAKILANFKSADIETIAYNIFAEIVPSALLFSAAISSVVDHYADPSKKGELWKLIELCRATVGEEANHALMNVIARGLAREQNEPDGLLPPYLSVGTHKVDIREQGGLMSQDLFMKLAPRVVTTIFSLKNIRFSEAPMEICGGFPVSKIAQYDV